jgi:outer membrane protein
MKLATFLLAAALVTSVQAAPLKVGIVDMEKVYRQYYKTRINDAELEKTKTEARDEVDKRMKKFTQLREDFTTKLKALRGTAEGSATRKKSEDELKTNQAELESLGRQIDEFATRRRKMLGDKMKRMQDDLIAELQEFVSKNSSAYDLVFEKASASSSGVPVLVFSKDAIDFTDDIIKMVNKDAPASTPQGQAGALEVTAPAEGETNVSGAEKK